MHQTTASPCPSNPQLSSPPTSHHISPSTHHNKPNSSKSSERAGKTSRSLSNTWTKNGWSSPRIEMARRRLFLMLTLTITGLNSLSLTDCLPGTLSKAPESLSLANNKKRQTTASTRLLDKHLLCRSYTGPRRNSLQRFSPLVSRQIPKTTTNTLKYRAILTNTCPLKT